MTIEYIHSSVPSLQREALLIQVSNSPAFPFIRELNFKYGVRVVKKSDNKPYFFLAFDGDHKLASIPFAHVSVNNKVNDAGRSVIEYCYYSPYYEKERGKGEEDKRTLRGVKLGTLMGTLKKKKVIPDEKAMLKRHSRAWDDAYSGYSNKLGSTSKYNFLDSDEIQVLLKAALQGEAIPINAQDKYKTVLDKWESIDKIASEKREELTRFFGEPFYAIGANISGGDTCLKIGVVRRIEGGQYEVLQSFKHITDVEQVPDLIPLLTMFKVKHDDYTRKGVSVYGGYIPHTAQHDVDMDIALNYSQYPDEFNYAWMLTPCHLSFPAGV